MAGHVGVDSDGRTRWGLLDRWHPELVSAGFYDESQTDHNTSLAMAEQAYRVQYWSKIKGDQIATDQTAATILAFYVNTGNLKIPQLAVCRCGASVVVDGIYGPRTISAFNSVDQGQFLSTLRSAEIDYYRGVVAANPAKSGDLQGWINRVNTDLS